MHIWQERRRKMRENSHIARRGTVVTMSHSVVIEEGMNTPYRANGDTKGEGGGSRRGR